MLSYNVDLSHHRLECNYPLTEVCSSWRGGVSVGLICHHEYCWGTIAADRTPWHSDGIPTAVTPLPAGQVGLHFSSPQSQIAIPRRPNDPWAYIRALTIEIRAKFQGTGTLIDADGSFRISVDSQGNVIMEILGETYSLAEVPLGIWHHFSFTHNGLTQSGGASTVGCFRTVAAARQQGEA